MCDVVEIPEPVGGAPQPSSPPGMMRVVRGVLVALGSLYLVTDSLAVMVVGAVVVIVLIGLQMAMRRP